MFIEIIYQKISDFYKHDIGSALLFIRYERYDTSIHIRR